MMKDIEAHPEPSTTILGLEAVEVASMLVYTDCWETFEWRMKCQAHVDLARARFAHVC